MTLEFFVSIEEDWRSVVGVEREGEGERLQEEENRVVVLKGEGICVEASQERKISLYAFIDLSRTEKQEPLPSVLPSHHDDPA